MRILPLVLLSLALAPLAHARTWTVEKDDSGDYTVIQDAVDVAASGDTILIGPGHYTEYRDFQLDCCLTMPTYVGIPIEDLTIIGAHRDSVIIGPEVSTGQETIIGMRLGSSAGFVVESLTAQQGTYGMVVADSARILDVKFRDCWIGSFTFPDEGALFEDCMFARCTNVGIGAGSGSRFVTVRGCSFVDNSSSINFTWSHSPRVEDCSFSGSGTTHVVTSGAGVRLVMANCGMEGTKNSAIAVLNESELQLAESRIKTTGRVAILCNSAKALKVSRSTIEGGWSSVVEIRNQREPIDFEHNAILKGSGYAVELRGYPARFDAVVLSLQNNYWGTAEIDSVRAWVLDGHDDPSIHGKVKLEPILPAPPLGVGIDHRSTGSFKSRFRSR